MRSWADIRTDGGTQSRAEIQREVFQEYAEKYRAGVKMPPLIVFFDGEDYWLADGFHRLAALQYLQLPVHDEFFDVKQGTRRDAVLFSVGANAEHGLRRTNADKRRAVEMLLRDEVWAKAADNWIAKTCRVSNHLVSEMRLTWISPSDTPRTYVTKHGTVATMNTGNIGRTDHPTSAADADNSSKQALAPIAPLEDDEDDERGHREGDGPCWDGEGERPPSREWPGDFESPWAYPTVVTPEYVEGSLEVVRLDDVVGGLVERLTLDDQIALARLLDDDAIIARYLEINKEA